MSTPALEDFLTRNGLAAEDVSRRWTALTGGVSSDIWRVDLGDGRRLCVKRALAQLKVAADWKAPVSRNAFEWAWIQFASDLLPDAVPQPLAHDEAVGLFAMGFLDPEDHPVWKQQLLDGHVDPCTAAAVGRTLGVLHEASAHRADLASAFDTGESFHALRLEPYLLATALRHPDLSGRLTELVQRTGSQRIALVHGDVSPKNILVGPKGPVLLDAECAWYGDPVFDIAFCLNHLLLKRLPRPECAQALHASFTAFVDGYFSAVSFEDHASLESRAAQLLPALFLARVDGKSPAEYLTLAGDQQRVRDFAIPLIKNSSALLENVAAAWFD
ncbi:aminoglycoside phosphotransferase [Hydrogenophaga crassostreae]|uniref:Aminoglycoside phosphotransferase n=1 Tax=Hydrogenophaga crassostreae TaxID=1763535 RepID=A0A163CQR1_9BURK|nr:aminoglycoside phosphotransferase family protein [Hydrogenophaga crassostreae]AOW13785.1 aminoglycoside phosphotransferase [Hydrogenophaga crassostreae]OAD44251.1 aminoglycoside phosphotransferase [Hydrogenophaga crassostreae]